MMEGNSRRNTVRRQEMTDERTKTRERNAIPKPSKLRTKD